MPTKVHALDHSDIASVEIITSTSYAYALTRDGAGELIHGAECHWGGSSEAIRDHEQGEQLLSHCGSSQGAPPFDLSVECGDASATAEFSCPYQGPCRQIAAPPLWSLGLLLLQLLLLRRRLRPALG